MADYKATPMIPTYLASVKGTIPPCTVTNAVAETRILRTMRVYPVLPAAKVAVFTG